MKVAIYMRFGNESQTDMDMSRVHEERLCEYARKNNLKVAEIIKEIGSGLDMNRQGLTQMLNAPVNEYQGVLTENISRIGRDMEKTLEWVDMLEKRGKKLLFVDDNYADMRAYYKQVRKLSRLGRKY